ncbi:hypothetical protein EDB87DRAFT_1600380 [Lactarius vividus]|nr:hypothetical protein EDB87DRAFT_1600380 [Lactarius vividus]
MLISRRSTNAQVHPDLMTTWREILVEHAKFPSPDPLPDPVENKSVGTTDISPKEVNPKWRAKYAMPDETLVGDLCQTLDDIT